MEETLEWFKPTSGRITGVLALIGAAVAVVLAVLDRDQAHALPLALGAVFVGVTAWAAMLRPGLAVSPSTLVLRNMLETVHVPLVAIEEMVVRQVLAVRAGGRRYVSPAIGKSWRKALTASKAAAEPARTPEQALSGSYADFVEARVRHLCEEARTREGVRRGSPEQLARAGDVRREPAWVEIGLLSVSGAGFLLTLLR